MSRLAVIGVQSTRCKLTDHARDSMTQGGGVSAKQIAGAQRVWERHELRTR